MKNGEDSSVNQSIRENVGVLVSLSIPYVALLGFLYQFFLLREFGINSLHYVSPSDFLLAFLRGIPYMLLFVPLHLTIWLKDVLFNQRHVPGKRFGERVRRVVAATIFVELGFVIVALPVLAGYGGHLSAAKAGRHSTDCVVPELTETAIQIEEPVHLVESSAEYFFLVSDKNQISILRRDIVGKMNHCNVEKLAQGREPTPLPSMR